MVPPMLPKLRARPACVGIALAVAVIACASPAEPSPAAAEAFAVVAQVLRHPRCLNCHPSGDAPRAGDDRRLHAMQVTRGTDGQGTPAMRCANCHQPANQDLAGVPGAPNWHLAPRSMGWEGLDDHDLAEALKDEAKNGGRTLDEVLHHLEHDPLVLWGWDPGAGRAAIPIPHQDFVASFRTWASSGAASPAKGSTSTY